MALPSTGFLCTNCGFMMDAEQVKKQKERMHMDSLNQNPQMVGVRFGYKKQLFQKREEVSKNYLLFLIFLIFVVLGMIFILFFVYFR